jgi:hypothetical protein
MFLLAHHNVGHLLENMTVGGGIAVLGVSLILVAFVIFIMGKIV